MSAQRIHVIGAHGRSGRALCAALSARGDNVVAVVRRKGDLPSGVTDIREARLDGDPEQLKHVLEDADIIVNTANARFTQVVLETMPSHAHLVAMGSTRLFTQFPDDYARDVRRALTLLSESDIPSIMLLPSMIYGADTDITTRRLVKILKLLPVIPIPKFGRMRVQPIFQGDVTRSLVSAIDLMRGHRHNDLPPSIVIAGPRALTYRAYLEAVMKAAGLRRRMFVPLPVSLIKALIPLMRFLPKAPRVTSAEIDRLTENRCFSVEDMSRILHVAPTSLEDGLNSLFSGTKKMMPGAKKN